MLFFDIVLKFNDVMCFYKYILTMLIQLSSLLSWPWLILVICVNIQGETLSRRKVMWGCLAPGVLQRVGWKSTMKENGELCVMTTGTWLRPRWCVVSSTSLEPNLLSSGGTTEKVTSTYPPPEGGAVIVMTEELWFEALHTNITNTAIKQVTNNIFLLIFPHSIWTYLDGWYEL